jgi:hypothetical protein
VKPGEAVIALVAVLGAAVVVVGGLLLALAGQL